MHARARELIDLLDLAPHPEGGRYRRVHVSAQRVSSAGRERAALSAIHYLLTEREFSRWHRVDADECWHHAEGAALELLVFDPATMLLERHRLGRADAQGTSPLHVVASGCWQAARPTGDYVLASCSVGPAFEFAGFTLLSDAPGVAAMLETLYPEAMSLA